MSSAIITSWADWLGNIVIIYQKHPSSVAPVMISPVFSIGASQCCQFKVWSIRCPVRCIAAGPLSQVIIKVLIYCIIVVLITLPVSWPDTWVLCPGPGDHASRTSLGLIYVLRDWDKLYQDLQSWIILFNNKQQKRSERHVRYQFTRWNKKFGQTFLYRNSK